MKRAMQGRRGHIAVIEILIAFAVFMVSSLIMGMIQMPLMLMELMGNQEYMDLIMKGDAQSFQAAASIAANIPEWMMIVILLSEILMILVVILYCQWLEKRKPDTLGFRRKGMIGQYLLGILGGFVCFSAAYLICVLTGSVHFDGLAEQIAPLYIVGYFAGYMIQGMAEEVLCRGYLLVSLSRRHSLRYSILLSSVFFAVLHGMNPGISVLAVFNLTLFGVLAALLLIKFENIWIVGAFHSIWNFVQGNLYGIQVSGNQLQQSVFATTYKSSSAITNGGAFGMEGGLAVTLVLGAGITWLLWSLKKEGRVIEQTMEEVSSAMPNRGSVMTSGNEQPYGENPVPFGSMPQQDCAAEKDRALASENESVKRTVSQTDSMQGNETVPSTGDMPGYAVGLPHGTASRKTPKRENMGVAPNETPWRPEQSGTSAADAARQNGNTFNADYFKD